MESVLKDKNILLGISGGIAAYKAADLASKLTGAGAKVDCVMTANACKLVTPKTFEAITGRTVFSDMWSGPQEHKISHINLTAHAEIVVVAPATANIIAKIANGICDDLLSTLLCACWHKPIVIAPAMNNNMWMNPAVQRNVATIEKMTYRIVGPERGRLACGSEGIGRMSEPGSIIKEIEIIAAENK